MITCPIGRREKATIKKSVTMSTNWDRDRKRARDGVEFSTQKQLIHTRAHSTYYVHSLYCIITLCMSLLSAIKKTATQSTSNSTDLANGLRGSMCIFNRTNAWLNCFDKVKLTQAHKHIHKYTHSHWHFQSVRSPYRSTNSETVLYTHACGDLSTSVYLACDDRLFFPFLLHTQKKIVKRFVSNVLSHT